MSCAEEVVYQVVTPGEPEQNGRCCLNGVGRDMESVMVVGPAAVLTDGSVMIGSEVVGPLVTGGLELDVSGETRQRINSDAL